MVGIPGGAALALLVGDGAGLGGLVAVGAGRAVAVGGGTLVAVGGAKVGVDAAAAGSAVAVAVATAVAVVLSATATSAAAVFVSVAVAVLVLVGWLSLRAAGELLVGMPLLNHHSKRAISSVTSVPPMP